MPQVRLFANNSHGFLCVLCVSVVNCFHVFVTTQCNSSLIGNVAQGGRGGSGANGGNGDGGGMFVGAASSAALDQADILLNLALGGPAGAGGTDGDGVGGGLYVTSGGVVTLKKTTVALNFPSFSNGNIYGTVTYL